MYKIGEKIKLFERKRRNDLSHKCGVYAIYVGDHIYVGSSENLSRRLTEHRLDIPREHRGCRLLHDLYIKRSKDDFYYAILEYCSPEKRLDLEKYYIDALKADCNTAKDPKNPITHCVKIYQYDILGNYLREYESVTEASRKVHGEEGNISMAANQHRYAYNSLWAFKKAKTYPFFPKTKLKTKEVYMYDSSSKLIRKFNSISDATRFLMSSHDVYKNFDSLCSRISYSCSKKTGKTFNGFMFSFPK